MIKSHEWANEQRAEGPELILQNFFRNGEIEMLLTAQITEAAKNLPSAEMLEQAAKKVTVSTQSITFMFVSLGVFAVIFVLACFFAYKFRGNAGGALMAFVLGFVAVIVSGSGGEALNAIFRVDNLKVTDSTGLCILGCILTGILTAAAEFGLRYYLLFYMEKTGIGKHKAISVACGYAAGTVGPQIIQMLSSGLASLAINKGTFIPESAYEDADTLGQYITSRDDLAVVPDIQWFSLIVTIIAFCVLHVFLTLYMTRDWLEDNKLKSSLVAAGVTVGVACGFQIINGLVVGQNPVIGLETGLTVAMIYYLIVAAVVVYFIYRTLQNFPHGREKFTKTSAQYAAAAEERKKQAVWAQVNAINARNIVPDTEDDSDSKTETATNNEAETVAANETESETQDSQQ